MLNTRKVRDNRMTREHAQEWADQEQQPMTILTSEPEGGGKVRFRVHPRYRYLPDIQRRNELAGGKWFHPSNMRFFSSRVQGAIYPAKDGQAYFVTSERYPGERRLYSIRVAGRDGSIKTVGEFQEYRTGRAAHAAARAAAQEVGR